MRIYPMQNNNIIREDNAKDDQQAAGDLIDHGQHFHGQFAPQFTSHHYLAGICAHIDQQANGKDNDALVEGKPGGEQGRVSQPEKDDAGVQGIDDKARGKDAGHIPLSKPGGGTIVGIGELYLFEEGEVQAHQDEKAATKGAYHLFMLVKRGNDGGEGVAKHNQQDIAYPNAGDKAETAFVAVVKALLDDGKNDRPNRQGKRKPQG